MEETSEKERFFYDFSVTLNGREAAKVPRRRSRAYHPYYLGLADDTHRLP